VRDKGGSAVKGDDMVRGDSKVKDDSIERGKQLATAVARW